MNRSITEIREGHRHGPVTSFINQRNIEQLNPFVLWDHFRAEGLKGTTGFGFHGHSGVATISCPVVGDIVHEDTDGNSGSLEAGGVQLMAAGAGVLHKETVFPEQGAADAFQLWTLLPRDDNEMGPVRWSVAQKESIPVVTTPCSKTRVLTGRHADAVSPVKHSVDMTYLEISISPGGTWQQAVAGGQSTGFVYVRSGEITLNHCSLTDTMLGILDRSDADIHLTAGKSGATIMVVTGRPLDQPIISSGPSVHSSRDRLHTGTGNIRKLAATLHQVSATAI